MRHSLQYIMAFLLGLTLMLAIRATIALSAPNNFIYLMEMRMGVRPGEMRVLPDCSCTIRYVGTFVHGKRYTITLDKLD